jgi:hypothetical protein
MEPVQQVHPTAERGLDGRPDPVLGEDPGDEARVDQDVLVAFVVATPGPVLVPQETAISRTNVSGEGEERSVMMAHSSATLALMGKSGPASA